MPANSSSRGDLLRVRICRPAKGTVVVEPIGEADVSCVDALRTALRQAVAGDAEHVIVDLDQLTFLDASALGVMVETHLATRPQATRFHVRAERPWNRRVVALAGLDWLLEPQGDLNALPEQDSSLQER